MKELSKIFLIGPMGAGKSTIGRLLSKELHLTFKDSDREIEERTGADISWIFDVEGEEGFRRREADIIDQLTSEKKIVLATGGGVVINPQNRANLQKRGTVVYLETSVDQQFQRTRHDKNRPLLQQDNPRKKLQSLFEERDPLYRGIADLIVSTNEGDPKAVVQYIKTYVESS